MLVSTHSSFVRSALSLAVLGAGVLLSTSASAHIELTTPPARYSPDQQKSEPCGHPENPPGDGPVATYQAGETITVVWDEFINHQGHFRIALDPTGTDDFTSPGGFDDFYNSPQVLLDDIADEQNGGFHMVEVTLPDEPCEACTLQLIQVMDDGAWGPGLSDLYFQCADIVIEGASAESDGTGGDSTGGGGGTTGAGEDTGPGPGSGGGASEGGDTASPTGGGEGSTGGGSTSDDTGDDSDEGCSCRSGGGSPWSSAWLLLGLVALRRRRG